MNFESVRTYPISQRKNKFHVDNMIQDSSVIGFHSDDLKKVAERIRRARKRLSPIVFMLGGAVIKEGCSRLIIDLLKKKFVTHLAMNGSVTIHDFEIAMIGQTSEDVLNGLNDGLFGMAEETGVLMNSAITDGYKKGEGYGVSIAKKIEESDFVYKELSLLYKAYRIGAGITVHVTIGGDIIHQHPSCNGAALGATSFKDFRLFTEVLTKIGDGVILNIGSAVIMPEVFLKALTIARNLGYKHNDFVVANFDFLDMYRPRTRVLQWPGSLGAEAFNITGRHSETIPALHNLLITDQMKGIQT